MLSVKTYLNKKSYRIGLLAIVYFFVCGVSFAHAGWIDDYIKEFIYGASLVLGGVIAGFGGLLLDISISETILKMGMRLNADTAGGLGVGIVQIWKVLRDIINILFIFGLIYIGIKTILNAEDSGTRRTLGLLIVAALMINFSLYITQAIVDFTNIAAIQVHNQIVESGGAEYSDNFIDVGDKTVVGAFLNVANITSMFGGESLMQGDKALDWPKVLAYSILMLFFLIIAGVVFAMGAVLLIARFVALILYMIFSPAMFLGFVLPSLASKQKEWWNGFLKQAFFAPAFLFMLYLSLVVLQRLNGILLTEQQTFAGALEGGRMDSGAFTIILFFCLMIGFLYASIKVAQMMGTAGAGGALSLTQKTIGGVTSGLAARTGRATVGRGANAISESDWLKDAASKSGIGGSLARGTLKSTRVVGDSSFDVRQTGAVSKNFGTGQKGGYKSVTENIEKKEKAFAKSLDEVGDDDERVMYLSTQKNTQEDLIAKLKIDKEGITDPTLKKENAQAIVNAEKEVKKYDENIKREKNRRQIGSEADKQNFDESGIKIKETESKLNEHKKTFKEAQQKINSALLAADADALESAKTEAKSAVQKIGEENKALKELRKAQKEQLGTLGYAGVLEKRGFISSAIFARLKAQDHAAGEAIRKQYEKTVKKTKEEAASDSLKDTIKESAKKD